LGLPQRPEVEVMEPQRRSPRSAIWPEIWERRWVRASRARRKEPCGFSRSRRTPDTNLSATCALD